eukprot:3786428-Pyramimonas_sp.AAC.1
MAQPIGDVFTRGRRGRNFWRNRSETFFILGTRGLNYGATRRRRFYSWRPRAQPMAQPLGDGVILDG